MDNLPSLNEDGKKSFWKKPEGVTGMIFLGALAAGGVMLFWRLLPTLIKLAENTIYLAGLIGVIAAIIFLALSPEVHLMVATYYKRLMRALTNIIVNTDPIGILKDYVLKMKKNHLKMEEQIQKLNGEKAKLRKEIESNARDANENLKLAKAAKEHSKMPIAGLKARKAGRLQQANITLGELYKKMDDLYHRLTKMYEATAILIEDTEDMVQQKEKERNAISAGYNALRSAWQLIKGDLNEKELFDLALDSVVDEIGMKVGKMEYFMSASQSFVDGVDLQQGVYEAEGLNLLEEFERDGSIDFINNTKSIGLNQNFRFLNQKQAAPTYIAVESKNGEFDNLLK